MPLYTWRNSARYELNRKLSATKCGCGQLKEEKNMLLVPGIKPRYFKQNTAA
jgi:hypothetical protein